MARHRWGSLPPAILRRARISQPRVQLMPREHLILPGPPCRLSLPEIHRLAIPQRIIPAINQVRGRILLRVNKGLRNLPRAVMGMV